MMIHHIIRLIISSSTTMMMMMMMMMIIPSYRDGVDGGDALGEEGVGHELGQLARPQVRRQDLLAGHLSWMTMKKTSVVDRVTRVTLSGVASVSAVVWLVKSCAIVCSTKSLSTPPYAYPVGVNVDEGAELA
jgi:hypothetical protein